MRRELGSFETAATLTNRHAPFVVVAVMQLDRGPSPERLGGALRALQERHPLLAVRIVERGRRLWFEPDGTPPIPLEVTERTDEEQWIAVAEEELNRTFDAAAGPLVRCTYLAPRERPASGAPADPKADDRGDIVLTFHHAAMDAVSGGALLAELLRLCAGAREPGLQDDAAKDTGLPPVESRFPPAWRGLHGRARLAAFLARQLGDEVVCRFRARGARRAPIPQAFKCRILPVQLPEEETSQLVRTSRRKRATLNGALAAAFLLAVNRALYDDRAKVLRYVTFADLRPWVVPPVGDALGAYLAMLRYTARLRPGTTFWELAGKISRQVAEGGRRGDKFGAVKMSEWVMRTLLRKHNERMAATAVSYSGILRLDRTYGPIELRDLRSFVSNFELGPEYSALARLLHGRLQLDVVYLDGDMDRPFARAIASDIVAILRRAAETG